MEAREIRRGSNLDHRPPRVLLVLQLRLTTNTDDIGVIDDSGDEPIQ